MWYFSYHDVFVTNYYRHAKTNDKALDDLCSCSFCMKYSLKIVLFLFLSNVSTSFAQSTCANSWSYSLYAGANSFLSDLGGKNGTNFPYYEYIQLQATRPAFGFGFERNTKKITVGINFMGTQLVAKDAYSVYKAHQKRNLSVNTDLFESQLYLEVQPFSKVQSNLLNSFYINSGVGFIRFEPKVLYQGKWIKLQPLGTEGQNYLAGMSPYKRASIILPLGLGYKFNINKSTKIKFDFSFRKTFTDYLDDVSTNYANKAKISGSGGGELAGILSDPSLKGMKEGSMRGSPASDDMYFTAGIHIQWRIPQKNNPDCHQYNEIKRVYYH